MLIEVHCGRCGLVFLVLVGDRLGLSYYSYDKIYLGIDWNEVYSNLKKINDLVRFAEHIRKWLKARTAATP